MIEKVISGGQTGVDQAALDTAISLNLSFGGWCPKGRIDEHGTISEKYSQLVEVTGDFDTEKENYNTRTKWNIRDSDGTLIIIPTSPLPIQIKDGTLLTITEVEAQNKPHIIINLSSSNSENTSKFIDWYSKFNIHTLNIAGPRESSCKGIYKASYDLLSSLLMELIPSSTLSP